MKKSRVTWSVSITLPGPIGDIVDPGISEVGKAIQALFMAVRNHPDYAPDSTWREGSSFGFTEATPTMREFMQMVVSSVPSNLDKPRELPNGPACDDDADEV